MEEKKITSIEKKSEILLDECKKIKEEVPAYFAEILKDGKFSEEEILKTEHRVESYKRANENIKKAFRLSMSLADEFKTRWNELMNYKKQHRFLKPAPTNTIIDLEEENSEHFAKGTNIFKILLLLVIGSFFGVIVETLWCIIRTGHFESRVAVVFGPFNPLYGVAAGLITLALYKFRNRDWLLSFFVGFVFGIGIEYCASFLQELIFGSTSWNYADKPFNLHGRICLQYSIFWGTLGVLWIKSIYPRSTKLILKIPNKNGKMITLVISVLFLLDILVSLAVVGRWSNRLENIEPKNAIERIFDKAFPNEKMEKLFPNMIFS